MPKSKEKWLYPKVNSFRARGSHLYSSTFILFLNKHNTLVALLKERERERERGGGVDKLYLSRIKI